MRSAGAAAGAGSGRAAHCPPCMGGRALRRPRAPRPRHAVIPAAQPDRDTIKRLNQLFYGPASPDAPFAHPDQATTSFQAPVRAPTTAAEWAPLALERLPLWRVEWVVLPCQQCVLHVHAPHYAHMFEELFAQHQPGTPLLFGHLYLPGGSRSLGDPAYRLNPDARAGHLVQLDGALADEAGATAAAAGDDAEAAAQQQQQQQQQQAGAPTVGTLMEITRAVRMLDGKLMLLATAVGRFKVMNVHQELPYSIADVELYLDEEELFQWHWPGADTLLCNRVFTSMDTFRQAAVMTAQAGAAAAAWRWINTYELSVARQQAWHAQDMPREGVTDMEITMMVQEVVSHGVADVLSLPDGVISGRVGLDEVANAAQVDAQAAMQAAAEAVAAGRQPPPTAAYVDPAALKCQQEELLCLELDLWEQLDLMAALELRLSGQRLTLPFGLLQLRPAPAPEGAAPDTAGFAGGDQVQAQAAEEGRRSKWAALLADSEDEEGTPGSEAGGQEGGGGGVSSAPASLARYHGAASDGLSCYADPLYPPLRRMARLTYAVAAAVEPDHTQSLARQKMLESPWIFDRLRFLIDVLQQRNAKLVALAAVKDAGQQFEG